MIRIALYFSLLSATRIGWRDINIGDWINRLQRREYTLKAEGWVRTVDGTLFPVGTFHDGDDVTLWAGVELDRIELFTITLETAAGPNDPAQGSSGEVVLKAAITP